MVYYNLKKRGKKTFGLFAVFNSFSKMICDLISTPCECKNGYKETECIWNYFKRVKIIFGKQKLILLTSEKITYDIFNELPNMQRVRMKVIIV